MKLNLKQDKAGKDSKINLTPPNNPNQAKVP